MTRRQNDGVLLSTWQRRKLQTTWDPNQPITVNKWGNLCQWWWLRYSMSLLKVLISSTNSYLCTHRMSLNLALVSSSNINTPWRRCGNLEFVMKYSTQSTTWIAFDRLPHLSTCKSSSTCCEVSSATLKLSPITLELSPVTLLPQQVTLELSEVRKGPGLKGPEMGTIFTFCNMSGPANDSSEWTKSKHQKPHVSRSAGFTLYGLYNNLSTGHKFLISLTR